MKNVSSVRLSIIALIIASHFTPTAFGQTVSGVVSDVSSIPLAGARVTLCNVDTSYFAEDRTDALGTYAFTGVPAGSYTLNASRADLAYRRAAITTNGVDPVAQDLTVAMDTVMGRWDIIVNSPEALGGTNLGVLLPDGRIFYCHNTVDPFMFDPRTNLPVSIAGSGQPQGCVGLSMRPDSVIVFIGGADQDIYGPGTKFVKTYNPTTSQWTPMQTVLSDFRWYPTTTTLLDGRVLVIGGGDENNPERTNTCELLDPVSMTTTTIDSVAIGNEVSPVIQLYNGKVLMTHRPPQLYDPVTEQWDLTGNFVQSPRTPNGDHADHELVLLPEGDVIAVGYKTYTPGVYGNMVERYDPVSGTWTLGANDLPVRSRTKSLMLPNKKILVLAGYKEDPADPTPTNQYGYTKLAHYYDPYSDSWRRLDDMNYSREYHCNSILVPDGRVIAVGGEGQPGNEPTTSVIEAFTPPYLFKGIRPELSELADHDLVRGQSITFTATKTNALTQVVMMSLPMVTHFMNCGNERYADLAFTQSGSQVTATLPDQELTLPNGFYMLMGMVDDIPSIAQIVRVSGDYSTSISESATGISAVRISPNPATDQAVLTFTAATSTSAELVGTDALGRVFLRRALDLVQGRNDIALQANTLAAGVYHVSMRLGNGRGVSATWMITGR